MRQPAKLPSPSVFGACHPLDTQMYAACFGSSKMTAIFTESNVQQKRLDTEMAILRVQAEMGTIPKEVVENVAEQANLDEQFMERLVYHFRRTQNDIVALVEALGERCDNFSKEYIHYGATSQDIHITGLALILKEAVALLHKEVEILQQTLAKMAKIHQNTLMAGRTHGQLALPITFGYKVVLWLYSINENQVRLEQLCPRLLVGHVKGAVGTHASFGIPQGIEMEKKLMQDLGLGWSPVNLQPSEERYVEFLSWQSLLSATLGRICAEIRSLHRSEVGEVREVFESGIQVSSSAMPHKRNPELSETLQGLGYKIHSNAICMTRVCQEHERDATRNANEHLLISESCILTARLLEGVNYMLQNLEVDDGRMRENLKLDYGAIASEPVMMALAKKIGKHTAHNIIYECAMKTYESKRSFAEVLKDDARVTSHLSEDELAEALLPENHIGSARLQVDYVLSSMEHISSKIW